MQQSPPKGSKRGKRGKRGKPRVVFRRRSLSSTCTRNKNDESNLSLSKEILKFLGLGLIKFATFIVPNVIVCCLLRPRGQIEDRIVGPGLLLGFPLLRQFSICAFLHGFHIGGVNCLEMGAEKQVTVPFQQQQLSADSLLLVASRSVLVRGRPPFPLWFYSIDLRCDFVVLVCVLFLIECLGVKSR